jgi:uncharacterized membrane protein
VPVFPWFGVVLAGVVLGRALLRRGASLKLSRWRAERPTARALAWAGRKSLWIYLIHQPVLLAVLTGILQVTGPNPQAQAASFVAQCTAQCMRSNDNAELCRRACPCVADRLRASGAIGRIRGDRTAVEDQALVSDAAQACLRGVPP